jgi:hypothetical protein
VQAYRPAVSGSPKGLHYFRRGTAEAGRHVLEYVASDVRRATDDRKRGDDRRGGPFHEVYRTRDARKLLGFPPDVAVPSIVSPVTRPVYRVPPASNVI